MDNLSLPAFDIKVKTQDQEDMVFDIVRKKYIILTPEEWVRQHFVNYLINHLNYPKSLINVEQGLRYNSLLKRSDIVVYDRQGQPLVLVECKSTRHKLNRKVMEQIVMYNKTIGASYLILTNGLESACLYLDKENVRIDYLSEIPDFQEIA